MYEKLFWISLIGGMICISLGFPRLALPVVLFIFIVIVKFFSEGDYE